MRPADRFPDAVFSSISAPQADGGRSLYIIGPLPPLSTIVSSLLFQVLSRSEDVERKYVSSNLFNDFSQLNQNKMSKQKLV